MEYIYSTDGKTNIGHIRHNLPHELIGADKQTRIAAGWYDYVSTVPELTDNQYAVCVGFIRNGDDFTGVYEVHDNYIEATEADKDAALQTLGVDMTKTELTRRVTANMTATHDALKLVWDNLNNGQQKKLLKEPEVKELLTRYGIVEAE